MSTDSDIDVFEEELKSAIKLSGLAEVKRPLVWNGLRDLIRAKSGVLTISINLISSSPLQENRFPAVCNIQVVFCPLLVATIRKICRLMRSRSHAVCLYGPAGFGKSYALLTAYLTLKSCEAGRSKTRIVYVNNPRYISSAEKSEYYRFFFDLIYAFGGHGLHTESDIDAFFQDLRSQEEASSANLDRKALVAICLAFLDWEKSGWQPAYYLSRMRDLVRCLGRLCIESHIRLIVIVDQLNDLHRPVAAGTGSFRNCFTREIFPAFHTRIYIASGNFQEMMGSVEPELVQEYLDLADFRSNDSLKQFCEIHAPELTFDDSMLEKIKEMCGLNILEVRILLAGGEEREFLSEGLPLESLDDEDGHVSWRQGTSSARRARDEAGQVCPLGNVDFVQESCNLDLTNPNHQNLQSRIDGYISNRAEVICRLHSVWWEENKEKQGTFQDEFFRILPFLDCPNVDLEQFRNPTYLAPLIDNRFMYWSGEHRMLLAVSPFIKDVLLKFHFERHGRIRTVSAFFTQNAIDPESKGKMLKRLAIAYLQRRCNHLDPFELQVANEFIIVAPSIVRFRPDNLEAKLETISPMDRSLYTCFIPLAKTFPEVDFFFYCPSERRFIMIQCALDPTLAGHRDIETDFLERASDDRGGVLKKVVEKCLPRRSNIANHVVVYYLTINWKDDSWKRSPVRKYGAKSRSSRKRPRSNQRERTAFYVNSWYEV